MENTNKSEKVLVIIFTFILIFILIIVVYSIYTSSNSLHGNISNKDNNIIQFNKEDNNSNTSNNNTTENIIKPKATEIQIAEFSTNIYDKDENRVHNISLAISKINNSIIKQGEIFSFNSIVGPMNESQGFKEAIGFDTNGKKVQMPGGGMCQISSTIYNAALIANLEITERHPHSRRVFYVPKDKDATIYYDSLDLKFKNNTDNDIKIIATSTESNVTIVLNKITFE